MTQARVVSALGPKSFSLLSLTWEVTAPHPMGGSATLPPDLANQCKVGRGGAQKYESLPGQPLRLKQNTQLTQPKHFSPLKHLSSRFSNIFYPQLLVLADVDTLYFLREAQRNALHFK